MYIVPELCSSATFIETMGMSKANELLLLGRKIDAPTAVAWNMCSEIIPACDTRSGDPFHPNSLATKVASRIDESILALPLGNKTSRVRRTEGRTKGRKEGTIACVCVCMCLLSIAVWHHTRLLYPSHLVLIPVLFAFIQTFVEMIRGARRSRMEEVCRKELKELDRRFDGGEVLEAATHLRMGSSRSKL